MTRIITTVTIYSKITLLESYQILRVNALVVWSQFSDSDRYPVSIIELRVDADPLPPRTTAEQHHLLDTWWNCNRHSTGTFSANAGEKNTNKSMFVSRAVR